MGQRLLAHGLEAAKLSEGPDDRPKLAQIRAIRAEGNEPRAVVVRYGLTEAEAFLVEASLIDCLPNLTNRVRGAGTETGRIELEELVAQFAAPPLERVDVPLALIRLGAWEEGTDEAIPARRGGGYYPGMPPEALYHATRCWWRVSPQRISRDGIKHVVPVHRGVTRALYEVSRWWQRPSDGRWAFDGSAISSGPLFEQVVGPFGKRVDFPKGAQNPITYRRAGALQPLDDLS